MTMTTTETPFIEATRRTQKAFLQFWTDAMYRFFSFLPVTEGKVSSAGDAKAPSVPTAEEVVDHAFDYADGVLDIQREYVKSMLAAGRSIAGSAAWMAQSTDEGTAWRE